MTQPAVSDIYAELADDLQQLAQQHRLRQRPIIDGPDDRLIALRTDHGRCTLVNWASNDYLGLANHRRVKNAGSRALRRFGAGAGAARLMAGGLACHRRLEQRLARFLGTADALVTTTGFQANLAAVVALTSSAEDVMILDRLCHASTYDGVRLATGTFLRFRHNDVADLAKQLERAATAKRKLVCIESIYSMDGDHAPVAEIAQLCQHHGALLLVDEAHALGVVGPGGRGLCAAFGVKPDVLIGTCSKSLGSQGGFIAGASTIIETVVNRGRSFIFSTAAVPAAVGAAHEAIDLLDEHPQWPGELVTRATHLRNAIAAQGWQVPVGTSPIIPLIIGSEADTLSLAARVQDAGHHAPAIRPPTVPEGACRLRLTLTRAHTDADVRRLVAALGKLRAG